MLQEIKTKSVGWWRPTLSPCYEAERRRAAHCANFHAQTFPYIDNVYSDALCLTGSEEAASSLVVKTYLHAFEGYEEFRSGHIPAHQRGQKTLAWLYRNLHDCFCAEILSKSNHEEALPGDQS